MGKRKEEGDRSGMKGRWRREEGEMGRKAFYWKAA